MVTEIQEQQLFDLIDRHFSDLGNIVWESPLWSEKQGVNRFLRQKGCDDWSKIQYQVMEVENVAGRGDRFKIPLWQFSVQKGMDLQWPFASEAEVLIAIIPEWRRTTEAAQGFNDHYAEESNQLPTEGDICCLWIPMSQFQYAIAEWASDGYHISRDSDIQKIWVDINPMDLFFIHKESFTLEAQP